MPRLSCILCSRNDEYMGNARWRLETALNVLGAEAAAAGIGPETLEVLVSDWGSEVPLADVVRLTPEAHRLTRFVEVPPAVAGPLQGASPFAEVLALNAAARRATGDFIGRIDQDTLVGGRFLAWCCGTTPPDARALYFANRRDLPYRFAAASPGLDVVRRFLARRGDRIPVHRRNPFTGHLYWTSAVGIWLASRAIWEEAAGYDERLVFYNWMETDMIHRLRDRHPIVDLGTLTGWDFYHLEHYHPVRARASRPHAVKNPDVNLLEPPADRAPSGPDWGLARLSLTVRAAARPPAPARPSGPGAWAWTTLRLAGQDALDGAAIRLLDLGDQVTARARRVRAMTAGQPAHRWPLTVWTLWRSRAAGRAARHAGWPWGPLREATGHLLATLGLLRWARQWRQRWRLAADREVRDRARALAAAIPAFAASRAAVFAVSGPAPARRALVISARYPSMEGELSLIAAVQDAGYAVTVLVEDEQRALAPFYAVSGAAVRTWGDFMPGRDHAPRARALMREVASLDELMRITVDGIRVGRIAACTALRDLQLGELSPDRPENRAALTRRLGASLGAVEQTAALLAATRPDLIVSDHEYTPKGELFETALLGGIDLVAHDAGHRADTIVFKRYHAGNRDRHLTTLAAPTWDAMRRRAWTAADARAIDAEIADSYRRGDWYGAGPRAWPSDPAGVRAALDLDPGRRVAAVFPHVLWDAPVLWGEPLFPSYQEWFERTMRVAYASPHLTWLVKLHPSHVWREGLNAGGEPEEVRVLRDRLGPLPDHVRLVPADTPVSTDALLRVVDYCLTVRGTVGVEAARLGIPVITAGRARYTHHGFTVDSDTAGEYLDRVRHLADVPRLDEARRELADRFAYAAFLLRPWRMTTVTGTGQAVQVRAASRAELSAAPDIRALAAWFGSADEDFLAERPA